MEELCGDAPARFNGFDMKRLFVLFLSVALLLPCLSGTAIAASEDSAFYVDDGTDVISDEVTDYITEKNKALFALTGAEIVFVISDSMRGSTMAEYAMELFNGKKIGDKDKNNGILIVMTTGKVKNYYMLPGSGIEKKITSDYMKNVLNSVLEPKFKDGDYDGGAKALFDTLVTKLESIYSVDIDSWDGQPGAFVRGGTAGASSGGFSFGDLLGVIFIIVIVALIFLLLFARPISAYFSQRKNRYRSVPTHRNHQGASRPTGARRPTQNVRSQQRRPSVEDGRSERGRGAQVGSDGFVYPDGVTPPIRRPAQDRSQQQRRVYRDEAQADRGTRTAANEQAAASQNAKQVRPQQSPNQDQRSARRNRIMDNIDDEL